MANASAASEVLAQLCLDLRTLREQAGGPSVRVLSEVVGLGKSQVDSILNGRVRRPPDWDVVRGIVEAFYKHAHDNGRQVRLSIQAGVEEYWRPRYAMVEHAFSQGSAQAETRAVAPPPVTVVPRHLPPIAPHFAGRAAELAALDSAARRGGAGSGPLLITGMAGVGKTALAVAWAHSVAHRYPDGQLYVNLRGFDPSGQAVSAEQALRSFLEALGVAARCLPQELEAQVGLYRSLLARREMLLLLDNARDAAQVRPLLPGTGSCQVVVTSRLEMPGLVVAEGAFPLRLDVLPEAEARQLLVSRVGEQRISAEPEAADELIEVCGRLPIALAVVAARAAAGPGFALSAIVEETRGALGGLDAFHTGDPETDLRVLFSWSYDDLGPQAARLFRLLGTHIGAHIGAGAAASLLGTDVDTVRPLLGELTRAHLVSEVMPGRVGFHDLLRAYALRCLYSTESVAQRHAAQRRLLDHYVQTAFAAAMLIDPRRPPIVTEPMEDDVSPEVIRDREQAMRWFTTERDVVLAAIVQAAMSGHDGHAWQLGWAMAGFLETRGQFHDWMAVQHQAVAAARRLHDPQTLARNLISLGNACLHTGAHDQAQLALHEALEVYRRLGDLSGQGRCERLVCELHESRGRSAEALEWGRRAVRTHLLAGDREGEALAHRAISRCLSRIGDPGQAVEHGELALRRYEQLGDTAGQVATLLELGSIHAQRQQFSPGLRRFGEALRLARDSGDRAAEAGALVRVGEARRAAGDARAAHEAWRGALTIFDDLGHPDAEHVRARLA